MLTFGTEIVILYIAEECVRLRPIPPCCRLLPILHTGPGTGDMHISFNKKIVGGYYMLCSVGYAYTADI